MQCRHGPWLHVESIDELVHYRQHLLALWVLWFRGR